MKNNFISILVSCVGLSALFLTWEHYKFSAIPTIVKESSHFVEGAEGVKISTIVYTAEESKEFLKRDLIARGYRPVQISIQNSSPNCYHVTLQNGELLQASPSEMVNKVMRGAIPRGIGLKIASFLFWPFAIPSALDTMRTFSTYQSLKEDYAAKQFHDERIAPYSSLHRILFLKEEATREPLELLLKESGSHTGPTSYTLHISS